jgi:hypothetical protein
MTSGVLSLRMNVAEKYLDLARDLRVRAELPAQSAQRSQILALALHFESLADAVSGGAKEPENTAERSYGPRWPILNLRVA